MLKIYSIVIILIMVNVLCAFSEENYALIVGSHSTEDAADAHAQKLSTMGLSIEVMKMDTEIGPRWRLSESKHYMWTDAAARRLKLMDKLNRSDIWILGLFGDRGYKIMKGKYPEDVVRRNLEQYGGENEEVSEKIEIVKSYKAKGKYFPVIIASTANEGSAQRISNKAKAEGFAPKIFLMDTRIGKRYRVAAGVYEDKNAAEAALESAKTKLNIDDAWILSTKGEELNDGQTGSTQIAKKDGKFKLKPDEEVDLKTEPKKKVNNEVKKSETPNNEVKIKPKPEPVKEEKKEVDKEVAEKEPQVKEEPSGERTVKKEEPPKADPEKTKTAPAIIDWDQFSRDYIDLVYAIVNKKYDKVQEYIDFNGFFAIRTNEEGKHVTENYKEYENFTNFLSLYKTSLKESEFIFNLQKYALAYQRMGGLPRYICSRGIFDKNGIYKSKIDPYQLKFDEYIMQSENSFSAYDIKKILSNVNIGVVRGEWLVIRGMYFAYDNDQLYLKFIDFSNPCAKK